jgi:hypothetical protein
MGLARKLGWFALALFVVVVLLYLAVDRQKYYSVCTKCGELQITSQLVFFGSRILHRTHREEHTSLSRLLYEHDVVKEHKHDWVFGHGSRSGCGPGYFLNWYTRHPMVAAFMRLLIECEGRDEVGKWRAIVLDAEVLTNLAGPLVEEGFPLEGFAHKDEFKAWWREHRKGLEERVKELRERETS